MTSAHTYTYEMPMALVSWSVTRVTQEEKPVQRFLSTDPLTASYAMLTPYQFASNTPIWAVDLDGLEADIVIDKPATYKPKAGQVMRSGELSRYRVTPSGDIRKPSAWKSPNGLRKVIKIGKWFAGKPLAVVGLLLESQPAGQTAPDHILYPKNITVATSSVERFTTDPSSLDDEYLDGVRQRLADGSATDQDRLYAEEANKRPKALDRGRNRALTHGGSWGESSLRETIETIAPGSEGIVKGGKTIFRNKETGLQVVYDRGGEYFRVEDTNSTSKRRYRDTNGEAIPNNVLENGKERGRTQSEYNETTHFRNSDAK